MKELERLQKRQDLGAILAAAGAVLFIMGNLIALIIATTTTHAFTKWDAILVFIGPAIFGAGLCIVPSPWAMQIATMQARDEMIQNHWRNKREENS